MPNPHAEGRPRLEIGGTSSWLRDALAGRHSDIDAFLRFIDAPLDADDVVEDGGASRLGDTADDCESACLRAVETVLTGAPGTRERAADLSLPGMPPVREWVADPAICRLIADLGVDPLALSVLGEWGVTTVTLLSGPHQGTTIEREDRADVDGIPTVHLAVIDDGIVWEARTGEVTLRNVALSDSVATAVAGRPLDEIIDSPLTRGRGLRIDTIDIREDEGMTDLGLVEEKSVPLMILPIPCRRL